MSEPADRPGHQPSDSEKDLAPHERPDVGLIGDEDFAEVAEAMSPNSAGAILMYENVWAAPFATAVRRSGGELIASGRIPVQAVLAALGVED